MNERDYFSLKQFSPNDYLYQSITNIQTIEVVKLFSQIEVFLRKTSLFQKSHLYNLCISFFNIINSMNPTNPHITHHTII